MADSNYIFEPKKRNIKENGHKIASRTPGFFVEYVKSLFPIFSWIGRYNITWFIGDFIAGITIGLIVIPQSMGYAKVATLPVQYGLYSSFVGVTIYCLFATSKDMTIGPTAVMSSLIGQTVTTILKENKDYSSTRIASTFSLLAGLITLLFGLLRLGYIVNFVSTSVIAGFITGSAINITISQVAGLLGITSVNTRDPTYIVLGNTLKALGQSTIDAAVGLSCLFTLYLIKFGMAYLSRRYPKKERIFFFISILRNFFMVVIYTIIAYIINIGKKTSPITILKTVPSGLDDVGAKGLDRELLGLCAPYLPAICIVLILEHIAIAKSFGRVNDYRIQPSQEFVAIGVTNILGSLFSAYPATGSFSRSAIKSKSGVRTPLAGIFSGALVLLALYALTPAFYYIPSATLNAVVFHAVFDLITKPEYIKQLWEINIWDFIVFVLGVVFNFFFTTEIGIYVSVGFSLVVSLIRLSRPRIETLGRIAIASFNDLTSNKFAYVPLIQTFDGAQKPPNGVLIFRLDQQITYPSANLIEDQIVAYVKANTRRMSEIPDAKDLQWNDAGTLNSEVLENSNLPPLKAIVFDFSAVNLVDATGVQVLVDIKKTINRYANCEVEYHFANILYEAIQKALIIAGFGSIDQKTSLIDVGTNVADSESKKSVETKIEEISEVVVTESENTVTSFKGKKFFHLSLEEAVMAATNGTW